MDFPSNVKPLLIGLLVDVSGSMTTSIQNQSADTENRLQSFQNALEAMAKSTHATNAETVQLFAYGFGFGNPLSALLGRDGAPVQDLIEGVAPSPTVTLGYLANNWQSFSEHIRNRALSMFGATPMLEAFRMVSRRFDEEVARTAFSGKILFVLSDGDPTDGEPMDIQRVARELALKDVLVVSCYVTDGDTVESRRLYSDALPRWPSGAELMFYVASELPGDEVFTSYLREHNWKFDSGCRLFTQINQSEVLAEFLKLLVSPVRDNSSALAEHPSTEDAARIPSALKPTIFISYRRNDSEEITGRITDFLKEVFGEDAVFKDVLTILPGEDYEEAIRQAVSQCNAIVAVVGPHWEGPLENNERRIDRKDDWIAYELRTALDRQIPVIPCLVGGREKLDENELPADLAPLAKRQSLDIRPDPDFPHDLERLCRGVAGQMK